MIVHLVRHGQAFNTHAPPGESNRGNAPLTRIGRDQAERVAARLASLGVERLVASPMLRTVETADAVARATGLPVEVLTVCHEHRAEPGYDLWGCGPLRERYPKLVLPEDLHPESWYYGDEPVERAEERARLFLDWLAEQAARRRWQQVAVVTHGGITRFILARVLGVPRAALEPVAIDHTSLCTLRLADTGVEVLAINDTAHLAGAPELDPLAGISR